MPTPAWAGGPSLLRAVPLLTAPRCLTAPAQPPAAARRAARERLCHEPWLRPPLSVEGTQGLGAGVPWAPHPTAAGSLCPAPGMGGRAGPADMFTCCSGPACAGTGSGPSVLPGFAFGSKLTHTCRSPGPMLLPRWVQRLFVLVPNGEQVTSAKKKRTVEPAAAPTELGRARSRSWSVASSLIVVLWPGLGEHPPWFGFVSLGGLVGFGFFPLSISQFCGQGDACALSRPGCVKVYHGSARFGNKGL